MAQSNNIFNDNFSFGKFFTNKVLAGLILCLIPALGSVAWYALSSQIKEISRQVSKQECGCQSQISRNLELIKDNTELIRELIYKMPEGKEHGMVNPYNPSRYFRYTDSDSRVASKEFGGRIDNHSLTGVRRRRSIAFPMDPIGATYFGPRISAEKAREAPKQSSDTDQKL
jgi:hypothetical protein